MGEPWVPPRESRAGSSPRDGRAARSWGTGWLRSTPGAIVEDGLPRLDGWPPALAVRGLGKRYGRVRALEGVDLELAEGELVGLLGPNGAGKSTLVKIACGLVRPTEGDGGDLRRAGGLRGRHAARSATSPSCSASPAGSAPTSCSSSTSGWPRSRRRRGRAGRAARAGRTHRGARPAGRADVEGHAAAARDRAGAGRRSARAPARRADERARPRGQAHGARPARGAARARASPCCSTRTCSARSSSSATASRSSRAGGSSPRARPAELSRARGVEVETASGVRLFEGATRDDAPAIVARLVAEGEQVYGVRVLAHHARGRLPGGGGDG